MHDVDVQMLLVQEIQESLDLISDAYNHVRAAVQTSVMWWVSLLGLKHPDLLITVVDWAQFHFKLLYMLSVLCFVLLTYILFQDIHAWYDALA